MCQVFEVDVLHEEGGKKKRELVTLEHKAARVLTSSHFPFKFLSPTSLQTRTKRIAQEKQKVNGSSLSTCKLSSCWST